MSLLTGRLLFTLALSLVVAALVGWIGARLLRRVPEGTAGRAWRRFAVWWLALAADTLVNGVTWALGALGLASPLVTAVLTYAALVCVALMLWGLTSYVLYLFTGREGALRAASVLYAVAFLGGLAFIVSLGPDSVRQTPWGGEIAYRNPPSPAGALLFALAFLLPPFACALGYASLAFRLKDPTRRWRAGFVAGSILLWFGSSLALGGVKGDLAHAVGVLVGVAGIFGLVAAYSPPGWVRRAVRVQGFEESRLAPVPHRADGAVAREEWASTREARRAALAERTRELV